MRRNVLAAGIVAALVVAAAADGAPAPTTLRPVAGTTYRYRYVENVTLRVPAGALRLENLKFAVGEVPGEAAPGAEVVRRATWDVAMKLVETKPDGSVVVSLLVDRLAGDADARRAKPAPRGVDVQPMPSMKFDSEAASPLSPSPLVGRALTVRLSANARVLEASVVPLPPTSPRDPPRVEKVTPTVAVEFAQRFFQELPITPLRAEASWDAARALAPELGYPVGRPQDLGEIVETAVVERWLESAVVATLSAKKTDVAPVATGKPASPWKTAVGGRELSGAVTIDRATGLARLRRTSISVTARREAFTLPAKTVVVGPGETRDFPAESVAAQDETYAVETRLELVDAR